MVRLCERVYIISQMCEYTIYTYMNFCMRREWWKTERKRERRDALKYVSDKDEKFERLRISFKCVGV